MNIMKTKTLLLAIVAMSVPVLAQAEDGKKGKKVCDKKHAHMIAKFDKDGDGKLSEEERTEAKAAMAERKAAFIAKHDTNNDGKLDKDEKKAAREAIISKFDTDKDGKLSAEERKAAREAGVKLPDHRGHKQCNKKDGDKGAE